MATPCYMLLGIVTKGKVGSLSNLWLEKDYKTALLTFTYQIFKK